MYFLDKEFFKSDYDYWVSPVRTIRGSNTNTRFHRIDSSTKESHYMNYLK